MSVWLFEALKADIVAHAEAVFPEECVGVVVGGKYVPLENVDPEPEKFFSMSPADERRYVFGPDAEAQAVVHSHPDGPLYPTYPDMKAHLLVGLPFVMIGHNTATGWNYWEMGDHLLDLPLDDRVFRHGVTDCFSALRSWWWQKKGIKFPDIARRDNWWEPVFSRTLPDGSPDLNSQVELPQDNLYADHFVEWGFRELSQEEIGENCSQLQPGDIFLYRLNRAFAGIPARSIETHGGVYAGDGEIYHHLPERKSAFDAAEGWARNASRWLRYEGAA